MHRAAAVIVLVALVAIAVGVYGSMLDRRSAAIFFTSPMISYRYPGTYEGSARCLHVRARVSVTVGATGVTAVELLERPPGNMDAVIARIVAARGVPVDAVTGATVSSRVLMKAVDNALLQQRP